jgi:hypothetical protein
VCSPPALVTQVDLEQEPSRRKADREWLPPSRSYAVGDEVLFRKNVTGKWRHLKEQMPGVYNGATGVVTRIDPDSNTITVRLNADPEAEQAWEAAWQRQEQEIVALAGEIESVGEKLSATTDPTERSELQRRLDALQKRARRPAAERARQPPAAGRPGPDVAERDQRLDGSRRRPRRRPPGRRPARLAGRSGDVRP